MILNTHISLTDGKGLDQAPIWDKEGNNWAAVIVADDSPKGWKRAQQFRAGEGTCRYTLPPEGLNVGDAVLFCTESTDGLTTEWFGFVKFLNDVGLVLHQEQDGATAIKEGQQYLKNTRMGDEPPDPVNPLTLVNAILESNALRICNLALQSGQLPPLQSGLDRVVLGRDVPAGMALVAGYGALAVGLMWIQDERASLLPGFNEALKILYLKEQAVDQFGEIEARRLTNLFRTAWTALREHKQHTKEYLRRLGSAKTAVQSAGIIAEMLCEATVLFKADIAKHLKTPEEIVEFYHFCRDDRTWQNTRSMCLFASACGPVKESDGHRVSD